MCLLFVVCLCVRLGFAVPSGRRRSDTGAGTVAAAAMAHRSVLNRYTYVSDLNKFLLLKKNSKKYLHKNRNRTGLKVEVRLLTTKVVSKVNKYKSKY